MRCVCRKDDSASASPELVCHCRGQCRAMILYIGDWNSSCHEKRSKDPPMLPSLPSRCNHMACVGTMQKSMLPRRRLRRTGRILYIRDRNFSCHEKRSKDPPMLPSLPSQCNHTACVGTIKKSMLPRRRPRRAGTILYIRDRIFSCCEKRSKDAPMLPSLPNQCNHMACIGTMQTSMLPFVHYPRTP